MKINKKILLCCFGLLFYFSAYSQVFSKVSEYPAYAAGKVYKAGDVVKSRGSLYQCKKWPYSGWCRKAVYEPGRSRYWPNAWTKISQADIAIKPEVKPTVKPQVGGASEYIPGTLYLDGSLVSNLGSIYRCKPWPYEGWCSKPAYAPGNSEFWGEAWDYIRAAEVSPNSTEGQVAVTLQAKPSSLAPNPTVEISGKSYSLAWGERTLLQTMLPGRYKMNAAKAGDFLPKLAGPMFGLSDVKVTGGVVTEVKLEYLDSAAFSADTYQRKCSGCHRDELALDTKNKASKWLFEKSQGQLAAIIGNMSRKGYKGFCAGSCGEAVASYLHNTIWSGYREEIVEELNRGNGEMPDSKGARQIRLLTRYEYLNT